MSEVDLGGGSVVKHLLVKQKHPSLLPSTLVKRWELRYVSVNSALRQSRWIPGSPWSASPDTSVSSLFSSLP